MEGFPSEEDGEVREEADQIDSSLRRRRREKQLSDIGAGILASLHLLGKVSFEIDIPEILFPRVSSSGSFEFRVSTVEGEKIP